MADTSSLERLLERFRLKEKDLCKRVTDKHLDKISYSYVGDWERLPPYLDLEEL